MWIQPILAQAAGVPGIDGFLDFLAQICIIIGVVVIATGGYLIALRGRIEEGLLCIVGGFILAAALPIMRYLVTLTN